MLFIGVVNGMEKKKLWFIVRWLEAWFWVNHCEKRVCFVLFHKSEIIHFLNVGDFIFIILKESECVSAIYSVSSSVMMLINNCKRELLLLSDEWYHPVAWRCHSPWFWYASCILEAWQGSELLACYVNSPPIPCDHWQLARPTWIQFQWTQILLYGCG